MNKNYRGVLIEIFGEGSVDKNCQGGWINIHSHSTMKQDESTKMMVEVLKRGYTLDIITKDGKRFEGVTPAEAKIKICYNCSVTAPDNGIITWRPHISDFRAKGLNLTTEDANSLGWRIDIEESKLFVSNAYINDSFNKINKINKINKYKRKIKTVEAYDFSGKPITIDIDVDVYDIINAFSPMGPALQHALKKVLCAGQRGHKDRLQDLKDIIASVQREIELEEGK